MKTSRIIETQGSITKNEALNSVDFKVLKNTYVAEASAPYPDYYGKVPQIAAPNTLYLFTKNFYLLNEVLKTSCDMAEYFGYTKKLDVATSILDFVDYYHFAIRVKNFPDYINIHWLQECFSSEGIIFLSKVRLLEVARVTVFKQFRIEKLEAGIFLDKDNDHKGYICIPGQISTVEFDEILLDLRNNAKCELFDAAIGSLKINRKTESIIRIYSENLNTKLLRCAKQKFSQHFSKKELHVFLE